jgi:hypothetical protein
MQPDYNTPQGFGGDRGSLNRLLPFAEHMAPMRFAPVLERIVQTTDRCKMLLFKNPYVNDGAELCPFAENSARRRTLRPRRKA